MRIVHAQFFVDDRGRVGQSRHGGVVHAGHGHAVAVHDTREVGVNRGDVVRRWHFPEIFLDAIASGVVDPVVDATKRADAGIPEGLHLVEIANVAGLAGHVISAEFITEDADSPVDGILAAARDDDLVAAFQEFSGHAKADALGAAGNDDIHACP